MEAWCCCCFYWQDLGMECSRLRVPLPVSPSPACVIQQKAQGSFQDSSILPLSSACLETHSSAAPSFLLQLSASAAPFLNERRAWERALLAHCQNHNKWQLSVCHLGSEALVAGQAIHFSSIKGH